MARKLTITAPKSYATRENAEKAIARYPALVANNNLRYFIMPLDDGRYAPVFIGQEAVQAGAHFAFNVIG